MRVSIARRYIIPCSWSSNENVTATVCATNVAADTEKPLPAPPSRRCRLDTEGTFQFIMEQPQPQTQTVTSPPGSPSLLVSQPSPDAGSPALVHQNNDVPASPASQPAEVTNNEASRDGERWTPREEAHLINAVKEKWTQLCNTPDNNAKGRIWVHFYREYCSKREDDQEFSTPLVHRQQGRMKGKWQELYREYKSIATRRRRTGLGTDDVPSGDAGT